MIFIIIVFQIFGSGFQNQPSIFGQHGELILRPCERANLFSDDCCFPQKNTSIFNDTAPGFRPSVQLDDSTLFWGRAPFLHVLDGNTIYAILQRGPSGGYPRHIRFTRSDDTGRTWLKPNVNIRYDPDIIICYPSMVVGRDGSINVVWTEPYDTGILFSRSTDGGATWSDTVRVDDDLPSGYRRLHPDITGFGDSLFASWLESAPTPASYRPWVRISINNGRTWVNETQISCVPPTTSTYSRPYSRFDPSINRWYVMWGCIDGEVYVARSNDGRSWQASVATIDNVVDAKYASMDLGPDGTVFVVWTEARYGQYDTDIFLSKSTDAGVTWSRSVLVNDRAGIGANQYEPHVAIDDKGYIHVAWIECIPFGSMTNAYYTISTDNGNSWQEPNLVVTDIVYTITPSVPYSLSLACDTASYGYVGWSYMFGVNALNFFSTNCPFHVGIEENASIKRSPVRLQIFPNPFSGSIRIKFDPVQASVKNELKIYNIAGKLVKQFSRLSYRQPGQVTWLGEDDYGNKLPCGVYLLRFQSGEYIETRNMRLVR